MQRILIIKRIFLSIICLGKFVFMMYAYVFYWFIYFLFFLNWINHYCPWFSLSSYLWGSNFFIWHDMIWQILDLCLGSHGPASDQLYCRTTFVKKPIRWVTVLSVYLSSTFFLIMAFNFFFLFFWYLCFAVLCCAVLCCASRLHILYLNESLCCCDVLC